MKTICFDLDGVLCSRTLGDYENAVPNQEAISLVNKLYDSGNRIVVCTSRFMGRTNENVVEAYKNGYDFTLNQLIGWGVKFHDLFMGKPRCDIVVDDKAIFYVNDWEKIAKKIKTKR